MLTFEIEEWEGRGVMLHCGDVFLGFYESEEEALKAINWLSDNLKMGVRVTQAKARA